MLPGFGVLCQPPVDDEVRWRLVVGLSFSSVNPKALKVLEYDKILRTLADHTSFFGGRSLALALEPSSSLAEVRRRLAMTTQARDYVDRRGSPPFGGAHDMRVEIDAAERGKTLLVQELLDVRDTVRAARSMRHAIAKRGEQWPELAGVADRIEPCPALYDSISGALSDDGSVVDDATPDLARLRKELRIARDRIARQVEAMLSNDSVRGCLQEVLVTQRDGRYVLPVKSEFRSRVKGVVHDTSDSGATVFVEPMNVVESGNRVRELEADEEKEIQRILRQLSEDVAAEADALRDSTAALSELDLAFAGAHLSSQMRAVEPEIVAGDSPVLEYPRARHPLLDPEKVVPVDARVGEDFRLLVITGPNTGGKTVTLKTMGLLTLMAQSGLHVPAADGAKLSVFDGVYADIGDEQSIEQSLSTFSGHMTNITAILQDASSRSLVLLDELGAGTDPVEGAALAKSLLEHLALRGITTVASTHYSQLKAFAHATPQVANASVEFDVETLQPTFELTIGLPGRSNALAIAQRLGLPDEIVETARGGMETSAVAMEDLLAEIREARAASVEDREAAAESRDEAERWAAKLEEAVAELKAEQAAVLRETRRQAARELSAAQETIAKLLRRVERDDATAEAIRRAAQELEDVVANVAAEPEASPVASAELQALRPGQHVRVVSFNQVGVLLQLGDREAEVQLGRMRISVPVSDVVADTESSGDLPEEPDVLHVHRAPDAPKSVPLELDLRGERVADGLDMVDGYLDDAALAGMPFVHIIHGHGTGAMREAVRDQLRHHPLVARSRPGERGEGGNGVTVVYLRD